MKTFYTKLILILFLVLTVMGASSQNKKMPVTTYSMEAASLYRNAMNALDNADFALSIDLLKKALKEDPNFFLSQYHLAMASAFLGRPDEYRKYAEMAKNNSSKLSEAELILKKVLERRDTDQKLDNIYLLKQLADMYPKDPEPYYYLVTTLSMQGKYQDAIDVCKKVLEFDNHPGPIYNTMGYSYLSLKDFTNAEKSFDKYIQVEPNHPNPYDSKGDYYMEIKDYANAYKSFMNAYDRNTNWSYDKAQKAKRLMEMADSGVIDSKNLQGSWQSAGAWWVDENGKISEFKGLDAFNAIKVWSGNHFTCVGKYKDGDQYQNDFACGTFTLDGKKYQEDIQFHASTSAVGSKVNMSMEIKGDTLIQTWPVDDSGKIIKGQSWGEKYIRIK